MTMTGPVRDHGADARDHERQDRDPHRGPGRDGVAVVVRHARAPRRGLGRAVERSLAVSGGIVPLVDRLPEVAVARVVTGFDRGRGAGGGRVVAGAHLGPARHQTDREQGRDQRQDGGGQERPVPATQVRRGGTAGGAPARGPRAGRARCRPAGRAPPPPRAPSPPGAPSPGSPARRPTSRAAAAPRLRPAGTGRPSAAAPRRARSRPGPASTAHGLLPATAARRLPAAGRAARPARSPCGRRVVASATGDQKHVGVEAGAGRRCGRPGPPGRP